MSLPSSSSNRLNADRTAPPYLLKIVFLTYGVSFGLIAILHAWLAYHRCY